MEIQVSGKAEELFQKLKIKLQALKDQGKLEQLKELAFNEKKFSAEAKGTGFKSEIVCKDGLVEVSLDLNFLLKPMRTQIEESIRKSILKSLA